MGCLCFDFVGEKVMGDDVLSFIVSNDEVKYFGVVVYCY